MKRKVLIILLALFIAVPAMAASTPALTPMEQVKKEIDEAFSILRNPKLSSKEKSEKILELVDEYVDWHEVAKRVLGIHWRRATPQQREKFTQVFKEFVKANYADKFEKYSDEKVEYEKEEVDPPYARVLLKVYTKKQPEPVSMECRLINNNGEWLVYDILIAGVSMVNNYRVQINNILVNKSFDDMLKTLEKKVKEKYGKES
jgi:phospholipid transport system substrate-binding protein